ncbi:MAG: TIGR03936 family radical SAM-associated protein [Peptococcia bacterium]|jgi:radical SAM-linked protein
MLLCIQYSKEEEARFLSHLDLMTAMERAFRRAGLPLAFSEGFNPHPRVSFASALAVGVTSEAEYLDVQLLEEIPAEEVLRRLNNVLPRGLCVRGAVPVTKRTESLMALINLARYQVEVPFQSGDGVSSQEKINKVIGDVLATTTYPVQRKSKKGLREVDIRPGIRELTGRLKEGGPEGKLLLEMAVQIGSDGNVKPEEVVEMVSALSPSSFHLGNNLRIHRLGLYIRTNAHDWSPLELS